jgi:hypothetical protein
MLFYLAVSLGCGARESHWSEAAALRQDGKWSEAAQVYTEVINTSDNERSVVGAYLHRGDCYMQTDQLAEAYRDLLVGQTMSCWITDHQSGYVETSVGFLAMSEACKTYAPKRLETLKKKMSAQQINQAAAEAKKLIPAKYLTQ